MQALILAAGVGSRLGTLTQAIPKCMVEMHGRRLIDVMLDILVDLPIERIVLVTGYREDVLRAHLGDAYNGCPIEYVSNPDYHRTNNSYSVLVAADALRADDTLFLESDLVFTPRLLADCLTDLIYKAGPQPGFVIVLEGLPIAQKFDKEGREVLLDVFRDAAEFWGERKVQFRVFYSFA